MRPRPRAFALSIVVGLWSPLLAACADETGVNPAPISGALPAVDAGLDVAAPEADGSVIAPAFVAEGKPTDGAIALMPAGARTDGNVAVDVVLGPHAEVYGVAAALSWDPSGLDFVAFESSRRLEGDDGVRAFSEEPAGRLVLVLTNKGKAPGIAVDAPMTIATLVFHPRASGSWPVAFVPELTRARTARLEHASQSPTYVGGAVQVP